MKIGHLLRIALLASLALCSIACAEEPKQVAKAQGQNRSDSSSCEWPQGHLCGTRIGKLYPVQSHEESNGFLGVEIPQ